MKTVIRLIALLLTVISLCSCGASAPFVVVVDIPAPVRRAPVQIVNNAIGCAPAPVRRVYHPPPPRVVYNDNCYVPQPTRYYHFGGNKARSPSGPWTYGDSWRGNDGRYLPRDHTWPTQTGWTQYGSPTYAYPSTEQSRRRYGG